MEALLYLFCCWTSSREAVTINCYIFWFDPTGNRSLSTRPISRYSIYWTTDRLKIQELIGETLYISVKNATLQSLTLVCRCLIMPLNFGISLSLTNSAHDLSESHSDAGFGCGFSRATPPVSRNLQWLSSISPLENQEHVKQDVAKVDKWHFSKK